MARPGYHVIEVEALKGFKLRLAFEDRTQGTVDLSDLVVRGGVFRPLRDPEYFAQVHLDAEAGTVVWPNDVDLAPEELYARAVRHAPSGEGNSSSAPAAANTTRRSRVRPRRART